MNSYSPHGYPSSDRQGLSGLRIADIVASCLLWVVVLFALVLLVVIGGPWLLVSSETCHESPSCEADPTLAAVILFGGGAAAIVAGVSVSILCALRKWPVFPGAVLGNLGLVAVSVVALGVAT